MLALINLVLNCIYKKEFSEEIGWWDFFNSAYGHSRHGLFFTRWIVNPMLNLLKRTMTYQGFEPGTFGLAVSIPNH
jgi:hypothetical protein